MDDPKTKILVVDDQPANLHFLSKILTQQGYKVQRAISGQLALNGAIDSTPDLILLDIIMPHMDGYEVCRRLKATPKTSEIPIIFLSALTETFNKVKALEIGGVDYITKPFQAEEILARIEKQLTIQKFSKLLKEQNRKLQQEIEVRQQAEAQLAARHRELLTFHQISTIHLSTRSLCCLFQEIVEEISVATGFPIVAVERYDESRQVMVFEGIKGIVLPSNETVLEVPVDQTLSGTVAHTGQPITTILAPGKAKPCDTNQTLAQLGIQTFICLPMKVGERIVGTLSLAHTEIVPLEDYPLEWLGSLANYVASLTERQRVEIERKAAKAALEQQIQQTLLLNQITQEIRSSLCPQQIFQTAANQIGQAFGVSRCIIHAYVADPVPRIPQVAEYLKPGYSSMMTLEIPVVGNPHAELVLSQDQAVKSDDVYNDPLLAGASDLMRQLNIKSVLVIRTSYQGKPNGIICLEECDRFRQWCADEVSLLESVAGQMGIAIAQANLLQQETQRRIELDQQNHQLQIEIQVRQQVEEALRQSKAQLRASQQKLSFLVQNTPLAVIEWTLQLEVVSWNQAAERIFGYTAAETIGKATSELLVPKSIRTQVDRIIEQVLTQQISSHDINENLTKEGKTIICEWYNTPLLDTQGTVVGLASIAMDITERKQAEITLQQAADAAEAANRAKSDFLAAISHELRTPLNAILGFSQILTRDSSLTVEQREYLRIINRSGEHLLDLINDVLSMSKIEAGRITLKENSFDLHRFLDSIQEMLEFKAQAKGLQLRFACDSGIPQYIQTDESKLRQVLINLLGNGIKFTQQGSVTLHVSQSNSGRGQERFSPTSLFFEIQDTGQGIAPEEIHTLFDPFVQTRTGHQSMEGTGLGLTISREFIRLMGGEITVHSTPGLGSVFSFDIKIQEVVVTEAQPKIPQRRVIGLEPTQPTYRILVVEDSRVNCLLLVKLLENLGFAVRKAVNGEEAVRLWQSWQPHLIWMDIQMPVMDGFEATKVIKQRTYGCETKIIALTASAFEEQRVAILKAGCDDFVHKPFQEQVLLDKMALHLGVRYIYEESTQASLITRPHAKAEHTELKVENLCVMPPEWLRQLHQAAESCNDEEILGLVEQIPESQATLKSALADLVDDFRLDLIIELTRGYG